MKKLFKKLALAVVALLTFSVGSNYTVKEVKAADVYNLATDLSQFKDGSTVIIAAHGYDYAMAGVSSSIGQRVEISRDGDTISGTGLVEYYLESDGSTKNAFYIKNATGQYLSSPSSNKVTLGNTKDLFKFAFVESTAEIKLNSSLQTDRYLQYNANSGQERFCCYKGTQKNLNLFVKTENSGSGEEMSDELKVSTSLSDVKNTIASFYYDDATIELPASNEGYGTTYSYSLEGDSSVFVKGSDTLTINPTSALKEATLTITASINGVEDSLDVVINSASNTEVLPIEEAIKVANYFGSTYSPDKFYVEGNVVSFANETYGNPTISDDTGSLYVYGLYNEDGSTLYGSMETKPVVGDTVKLYGVLGTYNNAVQMKNGWMVEHTVNSTDKELIEMEKTTASLAFDYSLTYESQEVEAGISSDKIVFEDNGYSNGDAVITASASNFEVVFAQGTNTSNTAKYYDTGKAVRLYGGNTATISSDSSITKVVFAFASGEGSNAITADVGTFSTDTWTGSSNEIVFTIGGTSGHRRVVSIEVTTESAGTQDVLTSSSFANISILFGASVKTSLFEDFTTVKAGVMFSAGSVLDTEKAFKKEAETLVETDGVYSIGAELEIFAENVIVTSGTKDRLSEFITAAVYFVVDGETVILEEKTVSVESMVNTYLTEYAAYDSVKEHKDALEALKAFIEAE